MALTSKPNPFKEVFYQSIANISYKGDIRSLLRLERNNKIKDMVKGAFDQYDSIYSQFAVENSKYKLTIKDDLSYYYNQLPIEFKKQFPKDFLKRHINERQKIINRILNRNNSAYSGMAALSCVYSSPSFDYIIDKYKSRYSH